MQVEQSPAIGEDASSRTPLLAFDHRDVADAHARYVGDRVEGAGRQHTGRDPQVTGATAGLSYHGFSLAELSPLPKQPEGGGTGAIGQPPDDLLRAFLRIVQRGVHLDIVYAVPVDDLILRLRLPQRPILPRPLALLQHGEGAAHADEIRGQIAEQGDALLQPGRFDQHMIGQHVVA